MPLYDYKCVRCDLTEEHLVSSSDVIVCCNECDNQMDKQISASYSFNLKGDGFYNPGFNSYTGTK